MANTTSPSMETSLSTNHEALAIVAQAKVLSGTKLEQLVTRIQQRFGQSKEVSWSFVIQYGLKASVDHRRWSNAEVQMLHEGLIDHTIEEVAERLRRSPEAVRSKLKREGFNLRNIRGDAFSLENITCALHVQRSEILLWIEKGWLPATMRDLGGRPCYSITVDALNHLYRYHLQDVLKRNTLKHPLFEAYLHYCCSSKSRHTSQPDKARLLKGKEVASTARQSYRDRSYPNEEIEDDDREPEHRYGIPA